MPVDLSYLNKVEVVRSISVFVRLCQIDGTRLPQWCVPSLVPHTRLVLSVNELNLVKAYAAWPFKSTSKVVTFITEPL